MIDARETSPGIAQEVEVCKHSDILYEITSNSRELIEHREKQNLVLVISGPPGGGKDSLVESLIALDHPNFRFERFKTATTRLPRESERVLPSDPYHRFGMMDFIQADLRNGFLETNLHVSDNGVQYYGTPISEFYRIWETGNVPILRVDPNGAMNMRKFMKESVPPMNEAIVVYFYITPPKIDDLRQRLLIRELSEGKSWENAQNAIEARWGQVLADVNGIEDAHFVLLNHTEQLGACTSAVVKTLQERFLKH